MTKKITLIILAGGKSKRMGIPKGLLSYKNSFWILEQIHRFQQKGSVIIGLGYDYQQYFKAIPWFKKAVDTWQEYDGKKVKIVVNYQPKYGLFSTLQTVLKAVEKDSELLILPVDVPLLSVPELQKIIAVKNQVIIPICNAKKGHPVKLSPSFWESLLEINVQSRSARLDVQIKALTAHKISFIQVVDTSILKNLNTQKEWNRFLEK